MPHHPPLPEPRPAHRLNHAIRVLLSCARGRALTVEERAEYDRLVVRFVEASSEGDEGRPVLAA